MPRPMPLPLSARRAFEAAAVDPGLTPSTVSHAVRGLERSLGSKLFLRERRTILLTAD